MKLYIKFLLVFFVFFFTALNSIAQNKSIRVSVEKYGPVYFYFNSLSKLNNGIEYTNQTHVKVNCVDSSDFGVINPSSWRLSVSTSYNNFVGDETGFNLPLNILEVKANYYSGLTLGVPYDGYVQMAFGDNVIISNETGRITGVSDPKTTTVSIDYRCAVAGQLWNYMSDFYTMDLIFTAEIK